MKQRFIVWVLLTLATFSFQNCGTNGESALYGSNSSSSSTSKALPTLTADKGNVSGTTSLVLTGSCDTKTYQEYLFELEISENASQSAGILELKQKCVSNRYSLSITSADLQSANVRSGTINIKIIVPKFHLESESVKVAFTINGGGDTGGTTGGTTGSTCDSLPLPPKTVGPSGYILLSAAAARLNINGSCSNGTYGLNNNPGWAVFRNGTLLHDPNQATASDQQYMSESLWAACERKALCQN